MASVLTLQEILAQKQQYSDLSEQPSFTLTDILEEPLDDQLIQDIQIAQDDMEGFFEDQQANQQQNALTGSKYYQVAGQIQKQTSYQQKTENQSIIDNSQKNANSPLKLKKIESNKKDQRNSKLQISSSRIIPEVQPQIIQRHQRLQKMPLMPIQQINNMSFVMLKNVTNLFEDPKNSSIGIPTAISATGNRFLGVGTSMGVIAIFQIGIKGYKILGTPQQRKFGDVSSLSISRDNKYLIAGHQSGLVTVWDLYYFTLLKQQLNSRCKIIQVLFCSQTSQNFISNDVQGNTFIYTIQKYIWTNLKSQKLVQKFTTPFYDIRYHELQTKNSLLALCSLDFVLLISIKPQIKVIGKIVRPEGINPNYLPNVQMGRCIIDGLGMRGDIKPMYDVLLISWGKSLYIYRFIPSVNNFGQIQQLYIYTHQTVIYNIQYLSENIFITLDNHQIFRTIRIDIVIPSALQTLQEIQSRRNIVNYQSSSSLASTKDLTVTNALSYNLTSKNPQINCYVIHIKEMLQEIIYQRLLKNKQQKFIKSFTNTVINCTFNSEHKEIFFITKNSIFRGRLHKWNTFLSQVVNQQKNIKMAMKLAIQLKNQRLNIFSQKVEVNGKKAQKSISMFCEIGKIFIEQGLKDVKQNNIERARNRQRAQMDIKQITQDLKQVYEYTIEYFILLKCQKYLFDTIYVKVIKNLPSFQYWQLFIQSLKPFILSQKLVRIPSIEVFKQILDYFSQTKSRSPDEDNMKLIDKMIINLQSESLHYENAVTILADNKLYKALAYICSVNKDFISPCNKLLSRIIEANESKMQNAQKQYLQILKEYLTKLINGFYINDKKIPSRLFQTNVLRDISLWLSFQDTLDYFLKSQASQQNLFNQQKYKTKGLPKNVENLVNWVYKLLQQSSKLSQKIIFHQLFTHLSSALNQIQKKQIMNKVQPSANTKLDQIINLKFEMSLMLVKFGKDVNLSQQQLKFYLQTAYNTYENSNGPINQNNVLKVQNFTQIELKDYLQFTKRYFQRLHLLNLQIFSLKEEQQTPYKAICSHKNDWVKYYFNFKISNINKPIKCLNKDTQILKNDQGGFQVNDNKIQTVDKDNQSILSEQQAKSQKLENKKSRFSQSSSQSNKIATSTQLIQNLFGQSDPKGFQIPSVQSSHADIYESLQKIRALNITLIPLTTKLQELSDFQQRQNNTILVDFILSNSTFQQIDPFIQSLIKINSQLAIVYILEHYELETVNSKIQLIQQEEVKYFVVRRIIKMIRKFKKNDKLVEEIEQLNVQNKKVWGNQYRSYTKKKQSLSSIKMKHSSTFFNINSPKATLSKSTLLFYIRSLAKYKREKRVYSELKHNMEDYQDFIQEVLKIVEQFKLNSCIGLIYEHMQQRQKAFQSYQLVYNQRMEVNVQKLALVQHCHGRFLRQIFNQMLSISQIINKTSQWMKLLQSVIEPLVEENRFLRRKKQQVIELIQKVYSANPNHPFIQELGQLVQIALLQVSSHTPTDKISEIFSHYSDLMNKTFMLNCLKSTMHTYSKSIFIYEVSNSMVINDQANQFDQVYTENKIKGVSYIPICQVCSQLIQYRDKIVAYKCSHMYHKKCIDPDQERCKKCVLVEVGETDNFDHSVCELEQLKNKKKESTKYQQSNKKINIMEQKENILSEQVRNHQNEQKQSQKVNNIFRCLAFDEYLQKEQIVFDQFRREYDNYLAKYE